MRRCRAAPGQARGPATVSGEPRRTLCHSCHVRQGEDARRRRPGSQETCPLGLPTPPSRIRGMRKVRRRLGFGCAHRTDFSPVHSPVSRVFLCARPQVRTAARRAPEKECY